MPVRDILLATNRVFPGCLDVHQEYLPGAKEVNRGFSAGGLGSTNPGALLQAPDETCAFGAEHIRRWTRNQVAAATYGVLKRQRVAPKNRRTRETPREFPSNRLCLFNLLGPTESAEDAESGAASV